MSATQHGSAKKIAMETDAAPADPESSLRPRHHMLLASRRPRPGRAELEELLDLMLTYGEHTGDPGEAARHRAWLAGLLMPPAEARLDTLSLLIREHAELFAGPLAADTDNAHAIGDINEPGGWSWTWNEAIAALWDRLGNTSFAGAVTNRRYDLLPEEDEADWGHTE